MFHASREGQEVCAQCLEEEFSSGSSSAGTTTYKELTKEYAVSVRKQKERASRMGRNLRSSSAYNVMGAVRCCLGVALFLVCVFFFIISDGDKPTFLNQLEFSYQLSISFGAAIIASLLLVPSFPRHKKVVALVIAIMMGLGATMPMFWHYKVPETTEFVPTMVEEEQVVEEPEQTGRLLTDKDVPYFTELEQNRPKSVHYCVFIRCDIADKNTADGVLYFGSMDQGTRNLVKTSLSRLLDGARVEVNNPPNGSGVVFTIANVPAERKNISSLLERYGQVYYTDAARGVYELVLESDRIKVGEDVDPAVLLDNHRPGFAEANMRALFSLDAKLVGAAADRLAKADLPMLRPDIYNKLLQCLAFSWKTDPNVHKSLVEALVVYAPETDTKIVPVLWDYFEHNLRAGKGVSSKVVHRLALLAPQQMKTPVLKLWQSNPAAWNDIAGLLVAELEPYMIEQLSRTDLSLKELSDLLNYEQPYGTAKALQVVQQHSNHPDKAIARKVENTVADITARSNAAQ